MSSALVKELRERTGLGLLECKKALAAVGGDIQMAIGGSSSRSNKHRPGCYQARIEYHSGH